MSSNIQDTDQGQTWKDQLSRVYKIVIVDAENLSHAGSYTKTLRSYLTLAGLALLTLCVLTVVLVAFTPLKRLIPGYGDIEENQKYLLLKDKISELEAGVDVQQTYIAGLQKMLSGELDKSTLPETLTETTVLEATKEIITSDALTIAKSTSGLKASFFTSPVSGSISSKFDSKIAHYGVDVLAAKGTAVKAVAPGIVVNSDWSLDAGNTVSIQHSNNTISIYKHNSALLRKTGDLVKAGEAIAIIGNTGTLSDGPHLHFELWYDGSPVNPENYITF